MIKQLYHNPTPPDVRRNVRRNDQRTRNANESTYADHAHDDAGGRFLKQVPNTVVGSKPTIDYPRAATWTQDRLPDELPLGIDVNAQEPVGEMFEVEKCLRTASDGTNSPSVPSSVEPSGDERSETGHPSSDVAAPSPSKRRRKA